MRKLRTLIALLTAAALVLSFGGFAVAAAQFSDIPSGAKYAGAVSALVELGIVQGYPDNTFRPDELLTREQFATFVIRALGKDKLAKAFMDDATTFKDDAKISSWARGYVVLASSMKIITGFPDGTFRPQEEVTYAQVLAMLVRALGFDAYAKANGGWPSGYLVAADDLGLVDDLEDFVADLPIDRADMAVATWAAVTASFSKAQDGSPVKIANGSESLLVKVFKKTYTDYVKPPTSTVSGTFKQYLSASNRIELSDGSLVPLADTVTVTINGYKFKVDDDPTTTATNEAVAFGVGDLKPGDALALTLNAEGKATAVAATRDTYSVIRIASATTDLGETSYGYVTVVGYTYGGSYSATQTASNWTAVNFRIRVNADTVVQLDGQAATLKDLADALKAFATANNNNPAIATIRVAGDWRTGRLVDPNTAISGDEYHQLDKAATFVSVNTKSIVKGDVKYIGSDSGGSFAVLKVGDTDKKVYLKLLNDGPSTWTGTVSLLTDASGAARVFLGQVTTVAPREQVLWAHALSVTYTADGGLVNANLHTSKMAEPVTKIYDGVYNSQTGTYGTAINSTYVAANRVVAVRLNLDGKVRVIKGAADPEWGQVNDEDSQLAPDKQADSTLYKAERIAKKAALLSGSIYTVSANVDADAPGDETIFIDAGSVIILKIVNGAYVHSSLTLADLVDGGTADIIAVYAVKKDTGANYFAQIIVTSETQ